MLAFGDFRVIPIVPASPAPRSPLVRQRVPVMNLANEPGVGLPKMDCANNDPALDFEEMCLLATRSLKLRSMLWSRCL